MVIGEYPCCGGDLMLAVPGQAPAYCKETCPHCGAVVWHRLSRLDPKSYTEADFLNRFTVDDATNQVRSKGEGR